MGMLNSKMCHKSPNSISFHIFFCSVEIALLVHGPQRMNPYVLGDPLTLPVAQF